MQKQLILTLFVIISTIHSSNVITWIAPYAVPASKANLEKEFNGYGPNDGISHLALQFWVPDGNGGVDFVSTPSFNLSYMNSDSIAWFVDWAHSYFTHTNVTPNWDN